MKKLICLIFLFYQISSFAQKLSYACKIFPQFVNRIELQKKKLNSYCILGYPKIDSLAQYSKHISSSSVFYDPLFNIKKINIVLDTFNFFDNCDLNINGNLFVFKHDNWQFHINNKYLVDAGLIVLNSIRTGHNSLLFSFQDIRSEFEIDFSLQIIANHEPELKWLSREYPIRPLKEPTDEDIRKFNELWQKFIDDN